MFRHTQRNIATNFQRFSFSSNFNLLQASGIFKYHKSRNFHVTSKANHACFSILALPSRDCFRAHEKTSKFHINREKTHLNHIRPMHVTPIPSSWGESNNYAYLLIDEATKHGWLIDAAFPKDVLSFFQEKKPLVELKAIVNTHHHWDHAGGNKTFHKKYPDLPIIGGKDSELVTYTPSHKEVIDLGDNISITALHTPCHTQDSICYYAKDLKTGDKAVFTGDTLFVSGCGRFFEGNAAEMNAALNNVLGKLPAETVVYSGHEYTKLNVKFSEKILQNSALSKLKLLAEENEYTAGKSTIGDELEFNPFMRLSDPQVLKATGETDPVEVMAKLREMKNKG